MTDKIKRMYNKSVTYSFRSKMIEVLNLNNYKGSWKKCSNEYLIRRLEEELEELKTAKNEEDIVKEAIDIANFAMMIWDNNY